MRAATRGLLRRIAMRYPCVVISGRTRVDVLRRLCGVPVVEAIGNHGIEPWQISRRGVGAVRQWRQVLARRLARWPGVKIEDKAYSIAVHYRQARAKEMVRTAICRAASALGEVRLIPGKQVVNVLPKDAPHKGIALQKARTRFECETAVYVGDDDTDEDVFALDQPGQLLTIRVGRKRESLASYFLRDQAEIDQLLRALVGARPGQRHCAVKSSGQ
jgi:trehalose 6-phosphate phosphatase